MQDVSKYTDVELVYLLRKGDREAFSEIFNRYHLQLFRFTYKKVKEEEVAKDVVQDIFVRLWANSTNISSDTKLSNYLYRAVYNRSLDWLKSQSVREDYVASFQHFLDGVVEGTDYRIREEDMDHLIEAEVAALPPRMREVIDLRRKENLSNREIAERLGLSEQTVETHFKRAFRVLRGRLRTTIPLGYFLYWWFLY